MTSTEIREIHAAMRAVPPSAIAPLVRRLDGLAVEALHSGELVDLWWTFCEDAGDALATTDPATATRLYELAEESYVKDGSYATAGAEGMAAIGGRDRVRAKLRRIRP